MAKPTITDIVITEKGEHWLKPVAAGVRLTVAIVIMLSALSASAQLTELPASAVPCKYLDEWREKLEWGERKDKENRLQYFWAKQNQPGQIGDCNHLKGFPDSCERVSWVARITSKRDDWRGWGFPDRAQAVYHFEGGVNPGDFCLGK